VTTGGVGTQTRCGRQDGDHDRDVAVGKVSTGDTSTLEDLSVLAKLQATDEG
jgi:hypothetical protein